jgi:hypothetical protein
VGNYFGVIIFLGKFGFLGFGFELGFLKVL